MSIIVAVKVVETLFHLCKLYPLTAAGTNNTIFPNFHYVHNGSMNIGTQLCIELFITAAEIIHSAHH